MPLVGFNYWFSLCVSERVDGKTFGDTFKEDERGLTMSGERGDVARRKTYTWPEEVSTPR